MERICQNEENMKIKLIKTSKIKCFRPIIENVIIYGSEMWTLTKRLDIKLDGTYIRMLKCALDITCKSHLTINTL